MKSFLLKGKKPIVKWGMIPNEVYFEGKVPEGYRLAVCPSGNEGYVILDIDKHDGGENGFNHLPEHLLLELSYTYHYNTKNNGRHYWFKYTGNKYLRNKASGLGIDLRNKNGYVVWYPEKDVRDVVKEGLIKETSKEMNIWLEKLFVAGKRLKPNENGKQGTES